MRNVSHLNVVLVHEGHELYWHFFADLLSEIASLKSYAERNKLDDVSFSTGELVRAIAIQNLHSIELFLADADYDHGARVD